MGTCCNYRHLPPPPIKSRDKVLQVWRSNTEPQVGSSIKGFAWRECPSFYPRASPEPHVLGECWLAANERRTCETLTQHGINNSTLWYPIQKWSVVNSYNGRTCATSYIYYNRNLTYVVVDPWNSWRNIDRGVILRRVVDIEWCIIVNGEFIEDFFKQYLVTQ